jgi:Mce-associated membrane protein
MTTHTHDLGQDMSATGEKPHVAMMDTESELTGESTEYPQSADTDEAIDNAPNHDAATVAPQTSSDGRKTIAWSHVLAFGLLPLLAIVLAAAAAWLKWHDGTVRDSGVVRAASVQSAENACVALLSYQPDRVDAQLHAASQLLIGGFKESYTDLTNKVVIPGAKQKQISSAASVTAASSVSVTPSHAVDLVFIDQTVIVGNGAPTATSSAVRVTLEKINGRWLVSGFDPV